MSCFARSTETEAQEKELRARTDDSHVLPDQLGVLRRELLDQMHLASLKAGERYAGLDTEPDG
jgi:hypothetical protein